MTVPTGPSPLIRPFGPPSPRHILPSSFLCLSQESSRCASARREDSFQPKDLGWLDPCDKHRDEGGKIKSYSNLAKTASTPFNPVHHNKLPGKPSGTKQ
ncbi:hypothetical protein CFBP6625_10995 [Agrobacterium tumefaciens]|nr:hypothetical protein CFBP6625_10995 [Agrobacterium tumefaciens]